MFSTVANYGSNAIFGSDAGNPTNYYGTNGIEAIAGPTFGSLLPDIWELGQQAYTGEMTSERTMMKIKGLFPGQNAMLFDEGARHIIKENF